MLDENEIDIIRETLQQHIPQTTFTGLTNFKFNVNQDRSTDSLLDKISKTSTSLGGISDICIGIQLGGSSGKNKKGSFLANRSLDKTHKPVLDGKNINTYELKWDGIYVRYGKWLHRKREEKYFLNPKILVRQIGSTPIATYDDKFFYTLNTIYNVLITDERMSTKYVLAIMNSSLGKWYWLKEHSDFKSLFPKIKKEQLERLPIRTNNFSDTSDKARHDHIVNLVEQMLVAKEKLANTKTDAEVTRLEMQCESLDRQIDAAVYELYGLTEEEIKIVEGKPYGRGLLAQE